MAYKDLGKAAQGGPYGGAMPKANSKRPQNYLGAFVTDIEYRGDGKQAVDPAPSRAKENICLHRRAATTAQAPTPPASMNPAAFSRSVANG